MGASVKDLFLANADIQNRDKTDALEEKLDILRDEIRISMFENYLEKCLWLDMDSGNLGKLKFSKVKVDFTPFDPSDAQATSFIQSLEKDEAGRFVILNEFANVTPTLVKQHPWTAPTLHIYDDKFREQNQLDEFYSLYKGLKSLCNIGAPVLQHEAGDNRNAIPVILLRPSLRSGDITQLSVKEFPAKEIVWIDSEF